MENTKQDIFDKIERLESKSNGKQQIRYILNSIGLIPPLSGLSALTSVWSEAEQNKYNKALKQLHQVTDTELEQIREKIDTLLSEPTETKMIITLSSIIGEKHTEDLMSGKNKLLITLLHPESILELQPFANKGFLKLESSDSEAEFSTYDTLNEISDIKRNTGIGLGYYISLVPTLQEQLKKIRDREEYLRIMNT